MESLLSFLFLRKNIKVPYSLLYEKIMLFYMQTFACYRKAMASTGHLFEQTNVWLSTFIRLNNFIKFTDSI